MIPPLLQIRASPRSPPKVEPRISKVLAATDCEMSTVTCIAEVNIVNFARLPPVANTMYLPTCPAEKIAALATTVMPDWVAVIGALAMVVRMSCEMPPKYLQGRWVPTPDLNP